MKPGSTIRNIVLGAVYVFGVLMILGALGGGEDTTADAAPESDGNTDDLEQEQDSADSSADNSDDSSESGSDESSDTDSSESGDSDDSSSSSSSTFSVHVDYSGDWSGSIAADDSSDELTIQILQDGEVISEQSTTAEYGMAQTTHSNF